jgi:molybdopterin synthase catalytic subunit
MFEITPDPIDINTVLRETSTEEDGGVVLFLGTVRQHTGKKKVGWLEYESYQAMALRSFQKIAEDVYSQWGVRRLSIVHRTGKCTVGEIAVAIVAASTHRREAFEACRYAIEQLKENSPIWKKEMTNSDCLWVGSESAEDTPCLK